MDRRPRRSYLESQPQGLPLTVPFVTNRREIKYLVGAAEAEEFKSRVTDLFVRDTHDDGSGYLSHSVYFDSTDLTFFRQQIEGAPTRSKPRLRTYRPSLDTPPSAIFLEFKHRDADIITKERTALNADQAERLLRGDLVAPLDDAIIEKFATLRERMSLMNCVSILYHRTAFASTDQPGLRITFDCRLQYSGSFDLTPPLGTLKPIELADRAVIELKFNGDLPAWITNAAAELGFQPSAYSKYANGVQRAHPHGPPVTP